MEDGGAEKGQPWGTHPQCGPSRPTMSQPPTAVVLETVPDRCRPSPPRALDLVPLKRVVEVDPAMLASPEVMDRYLPGRLPPSICEQGNTSGWTNSH